jgi:hypothetical protein
MESIANGKEPCLITARQVLISLYTMKFISVVSGTKMLANHFSVSSPLVDSTHGCYKPGENIIIFWSNWA